jgi:hypothetical protein
MYGPRDGRLLSDIILCCLLLDLKLMEVISQESDRRGVVRGHSVESAADDSHREGIGTRARKFPVSDVIIKI